MKILVYPAIAEKNERFKNFCVYFPDLPGCASTGKDLDECRLNATQALELHLKGMLADGDEIPAPSAIESLTPAANETAFLVEVAFA